MAIFKNKKNVLMTIMVVVTIVVFAMGTMTVGTEVNGLSKACQNSVACMEAVAKEEEANKNAAASAEAADAFQAKVDELSMDISSKETEIAETEANIAALKQQITETEEKLSQEQEALAELLVNMHFESDAEPIRVLAGASSISDLAERAAREEVVKQQISAAAKAVKETKAELEANKSEVEELLVQQQSSKQALMSKRVEQQDLVEKYKDDAEAYTEIAKAAQEAQREAEKAEQEAHPELYGGRAYSGDGTNTYPWQGDCPQKQDYFGTVIDGHYIGGYVCECVSYTGWKAYEAYGLVLAWGNAYNWDNRARAAGYTVDRNPEAGTIGQVDSGVYGHVFWVESINGDGSINVTEYNNSYATYLYSGSSHFGDFGARTIPASEVSNYNYIHLR